MRGGNIVASGKWVKTALRWALLGGSLSFLIAPFTAAFGANDIGERVGIFAVTVVGIALAFAAVPVAVAIWFLLLHMLWQAGRAARGVEDEK
jgi:hypothetical protein